MDICRDDEAYILAKALVFNHVGAIFDDEEIKQIKFILNKYDMDLSEDSYYDILNREGVYE